MHSWLRTIRRSPVSPWAFAAFAAICVLFLPYFIHQSPSNSYSWLFGYNNRAATLLILFFAVSGGYLFRDSCKLPLPRAGGGPIHRGALLFALGTTTLICVGMYLLVGRFGAFGESFYNLHRVWMLTLGKRPYIDFEWPFGVVQLYVPLWLHHFFHLSLEQAVYLYWYCAAIAGTCLLYAIVQRIDCASVHRTRIFLLLYIGTAPALLSTGSQYTMFRYTAPLFLALTLFRHSRASQPDQAKLISFVWVATIGLLLISPEATIAFVFAAIILLLPLGKRPALSLSHHILLCFGAIAILHVAYRLHELDTALSSSAGAESFPVVLSAYTLFIFWIIAIASVTAFQAWNTEGWTSNVIALILPGVPLLSAAFGRADPGHMLFNILGMVIVAFVCCSASPILWRSFVFAYFVSFIVLSIPEIAMQLHTTAVVAIQQEVTQAKLRPNTPTPLVNLLMSTPAKRWTTGIIHTVSSPVPAHIDFASVYPGWHLDSNTIFEAPLGYAPLGGLNFYLSPQIDYGYYKGQENSHSLKALHRHLQELQQAPERDLLLPAGFSSCYAMNATAARRDLARISYSYYLMPSRHQENLMTPLCQYIATQYVRAVPAGPQNWNYDLWVPRSRALLFERYAKR